MKRPIIRINDGQTIIDREMNDEEFAQWQKDQEDAAIKAQTEIQIATKRQALLDKLGITEEEARLLLG